jgi:hypothetical protein
MRVKVNGDNFFRYVIIKQSSSDFPYGLNSGDYLNYNLVVSRTCFDMQAVSLRDCQEATKNFVETKTFITKPY